MKLWDNFRDYFYKRKLAERHSKPERVITNLKDAASIGIVYDSTNLQNDAVISAFSENLRQQGKTVDVLGFVNDNQTEQKSDIIVFNKKCLNWAMVPQHESVEKFAAKKFDLLIAAFPQENLPLEYVARISAAKWKVGAYHANKTDFYDIMINLGTRNELPYFLEQSTHFLNEIKYDSY